MNKKQLIDQTKAKINNVIGKLLQDFADHFGLNITEIEIEPDSIDSFHNFHGEFDEELKEIFSHWQNLAKWEYEDLYVGNTTKNGFGIYYVPMNHMGVALGDPIFIDLEKELK